MKFFFQTIPPKPEPPYVTPARDHDLQLMGRNVVRVKGYAPKTS